jgi:hypothetical protein
MLASATPAAAGVGNAAYLSGFPDSRPMTMALAPTAASASASSDPIFRSLFQAGERSQPVSPAVQELWGKSSSQTSAPQRLDLFSDRSGVFSG